MTVDISLETLLETGAHFGHQSKRWNPKMKDYIYGTQDGVHIFDLVKTKEALEQAFSVVADYITRGRSVLFVGTKKQAKEYVLDACQKAGVFYITERWLGGLITNFLQIRKSVRKLNELKEKMVRGEFNEYTKKEKLLVEREITRLDRFFGGIVGLEEIPDLLVIIDVRKETSAVREAQTRGVPIIALVDSNSDPTAIDYPIPMNDDAPKALSYVMDLFRDTILEAKKKVKKVK